LPAPHLYNLLGGNKYFPEILLVVGKIDALL